MKQKQLIGRRTLLTFLAILSLVIINTQSVQSQLKYRGFIDGGIGVATSEDATGLGYQLSTTHGIQLGKSFIGLGVGITPAIYGMESYYNSIDYYKQTPDGWYNQSLNFRPNESHLSQIQIPLYVNYRYDFFGVKTWNFFVGAKVGVVMGSNIVNCDYTSNSLGYTSYKNIEYNKSGYIPIYASLNLGIRKRLSGISGLSFGINVQPFQSGYGNFNYYYGDSYSYENKYFYAHIGIAILANLAFDF